MIRNQEPVSVLIAILIAVAALIIFVFVVVSNRLQALEDEITASHATPVDVSGWQTYRNAQYGFEIEYPPVWDISTDGLTSQTPFVAFGNPLQGPNTYALDVFIENNTSSLSSGNYAHAAIAVAKAEDSTNASSGPAPTTAPQFDKSYVLTVGGYPAYELYNVFEFDHSAERIYVAHGSEALRFDFPMPMENANISLPVANNATVHAILSTLVFTN